MGLDYVKTYKYIEKDICKIREDYLEGNPFPRELFKSVWWQFIGERGNPNCLVPVSMINNLKNKEADSIYRIVMGDSSKEDALTAITILIELDSLFRTVHGIGEVFPDATVYDRKELVNQIKVVLSTLALHLDKSELDKEGIREVVKEFVSLNMVLFYSTKRPTTLLEQLETIKDIGSENSIPDLYNTIKTFVIHFNESLSLSTWDSVGIMYLLDEVRIKVDNRILPSLDLTPATTYEAYKEVISNMSKVVESNSEVSDEGTKLLIKKNITDLMKLL